MPLFATLAPVTSSKSSLQEARFQALAATVIKPEKRQIEMALVSSKINIF